MDADTPERGDVSTEPQRLALEAMSEQLLERLDAMVAEQEKRAAEFAQRTPSLSPLPEVVQPQEMTPPVQVAPPVTPTEVQVAKPKRGVPPPPAMRRSVTAPEPEVREQRAPAEPQRHMPVRRKPAAKGENEQSGVGAVSIICVVIGILFLLRTCN